MTAIDAVRTANVEALEVARRLGLHIERNGRGRCPWHGGGNEKHGALSFKGGRCHCFACGAGGDAIELAGQMLGLEAREAAEAICEAMGIAYDGQRDEAARERMRQVQAERAAALRRREAAQRRHTELCGKVRELDGKLDRWTAESMEEQPEAFWGLLKEWADAFEALEVVELEIMENSARG